MATTPDNPLMPLRSIQRNIDGQFFTTIPNVQHGRLRPIPNRMYPPGAKPLPCPLVTMPDDGRVRLDIQRRCAGHRRRQQRRRR